MGYILAAQPKTLLSAESDPMSMLNQIDRMIWPIVPLPEGSKVDSKVDRCVTASIDGGLDALLAADGRLLVEEARLAKGLHDKIAATDPEIAQDPTYIAGRLGSLADMLGLAAERCAPSEFEAVLRQDRFQGLLSALFEDAIRNVDLAAKLDESEESICRKLKELKSIGAVAGNKQGREVINVLLPAARAFLIAEWNSAPETDETLFDLDVYQGLDIAQVEEFFGSEAEAATPSTVPRLGLADLDPDEYEGSHSYAEAA